MVKYMFILVKHILHANKEIAQVTLWQVTTLFPKAESGSSSSSDFSCIQIFITTSLFFFFNLAMLNPLNFLKIAMLQESEILNYQNSGQDLFKHTQ